MLGPSDSVSGLRHAEGLRSLAGQVQKWIGWTSGCFPAIVDVKVDSKAYSGAVQCVIALTDDGQARELYELVFPWFVRAPAASLPHTGGGRALRGSAEHLSRLGKRVRKLRTCNQQQSHISR